MKSKLLLSGMVIVALVLLASGCTSSYDQNVQSESKNTPVFTALRTNDTSVMIMLLDAHGATDIKGLHVVSPTVASPDLIDDNTSVPSGKEIKVIDPALSGKVNLVVTTTVNGTSLTVLNGTV